MLRLASSFPRNLAIARITLQRGGGGFMRHVPGVARSPQRLALAAGPQCSCSGERTETGQLGLHQTDGSAQDRLAGVMRGCGEDVLMG
jgi:hypothetical protein